MKLRVALTSLAVLASASCSIFEDPSPEALRFRMAGSAGAPVEVVYSTLFAAGVNESGVTQVLVYSSDTVSAVLPIDTVVNIAADHRFFVQVTPLAADTMTVGVSVEIDGRSVLDDDGEIYSADPWRYVYLFNQYVSRIIEIVI